MSAALQIILETQPVDRIEADLALAGLFVDDRPLRGGAGRADWRLCGQISELVRKGRITGASGEVVLMSSEGRMRAPRTLIVGLGERARFRMAAAQDATRQAIARALSLGMSRVALSPLGVKPDDLPRHAQALLGGTWEAVREADRPLRLFVVVSSSEHQRSRASLQAAIQVMNTPQVVLRSAESSASARSARAERPLGGSAPGSGSVRYT